jgi:hypothetical protein
MEPQMSNVLVIACGATKNETHGQAVRAIDLYAGRQFEVARRMQAAGWTILILSAEHGFISGDREIATYDRKMTPAIAREFIADPFHSFILSNWTNEARQVVFYGGADYWTAFDTIRNNIGLAQVGNDVHCVDIVGAGCGDHFSVLKEIAGETGANIEFPRAA